VQDMYAKEPLVSISGFGTGMVQELALSRFKVPVAGAGFVGSSTGGVWVK